MTLYLHGATLLTPETRLENAALLVENGRIAAFGPTEATPCPPGAARLDAAGLLLAPGLIDLQFNGAFGRDFTAEPDAIWEVAAGLPRYGLTAFLPTIITAPPEVPAAGMAALRRPPPGFGGTRPLGLHLEGPFLNPERVGAHNPAHLRLPDAARAAGWSRANGVFLVTLAPELPGALELARRLVERGVVVSAGHSLASYEQALAAFAAGVRLGTHLFNAMPPLHHRDPGLAAALLAQQSACFGVIADGIHLHPGLLRLIWQAAGERLFLVTDAMAALGRPPGRYVLASQTVIVDETSARLEDGRLAGSLLQPLQAVRNLMAFTGCTLPQALAAYTRLPAQILGLTGELGGIAAGLAADLLLLTPALEPAATLVGGEIVFTGPAFEPERLQA